MRPTSTCIKFTIVLLAAFGSSAILPSQAQTEFKGGVFVRKVKKARPNRPAPARIPAAAVEANLRGDTNFDDGKYDDALAAYQQAIQRYARYVEAYINLGDTFRELQRYDEAIAAYKNALKWKPASGDAYNGLADTYDAMGRADEATAARGKANANFGAGGVLNGKAIKLGVPTYPAAARAANVSGQVQVQVLIDETGQVIRAEAISGNPLLKNVSVQAASESLFTPTTLGGVPVKVSGIIIYNFKF